MAHIYKITNILNNKIYIGKTEHIDPIKRWKEHIKDSKRERNKNRPIYKAINKYGVENFSFEILEETDKPEQQEIYYISLYDSYKNGYNATIGRRWNTKNR